MFTKCSQYLVHAGRIQSHHRSMGKTFKNRTQRLLWVNILQFKDLIDESLVEHDSSDIKQYCRHSDTKKIHKLQALNN